MNLGAYNPIKRLNIKGKRIRGNSSSAKYWIDSTKYLQYKLLPDYIRIVRWDYAIDPLREIVFYVPLSALTTLLKEKVKDLWKHLYILNQIQQAYFQYRANENNGYYVSLSSRFLNKVLRRYRPIIDRLISLEIVTERKGKYFSVGGELHQRKNEFAIALEHRTRTVRLAYFNPKRAQKAHRRHQERILNVIGESPNKKHIYETMKMTTILPQSMNYIDELQDATEHQFDCYRRSVEAIQNSEYYLITDHKTGRLFNNFTNLWSNLRKFIKIAGECVGEIDIANSQPLLAANLYPDDSEEKQKYLEIVLEGDFYRTLEAASGKKYPDYKKLKELVFQQVFFGSISDGNRRPLLRAFKALFPELLEIINNMKEGQKNKLALELQSIEANLVIGKVVNRLRLLGIPCLTVHDSVICKVSDVEAAYGILVEELEKLIGHKCKIKCKNYIESNAA